MTTLPKWTLPRDYFGARWDGYFVFIGQTRDSHAIERSNFTVALAALEKLPAFTMPDDVTESRIVVRESHWAVGWVEWIAIHESDAPAIEAANAMLAQLDDYPILDEMHYSKLEYGETCAYWERMSVRDRLDAIKRSRAACSAFAARHAYMPQDDNGSLYDYLTH